VPALPGCYTQGETEAEALANAREAAEGWLEAANDNASPFDNDGAAVPEIVREIEL
jgi:predicted RNase H-like HicB family nuclease